MSELAKIIPMNRIEMVDVDSPSLNEIVSTPSESEIQAQADIAPAAEMAEPTIQPDMFVPESQPEPTALEGIIGPQPEPQHSFEDVFGVDGEAFAEIARSRGLDPGRLLATDSFLQHVSLGLRGPQHLRGLMDAFKEDLEADQRLRSVEERLAQTAESVPGNPVHDRLSRIEQMLTAREAQDREVQAMAEAEARDAQVMELQVAAHAATFREAWSRANGPSNVPMDQWLSFMQDAGPGAVNLDPRFLASLAVQQIPRKLPDGSSLAGRGPTATRTIPGIPAGSSARGGESSELSRILNFEESDGRS